MRYFQDYLYAVSTAFLILISATGCDRTANTAQSDNVPKQVRAVQVSVVEVQPVPIRDILILPGETEAWNDILVPADTGGRVEWIGPEEGNRIKNGQLLARIDVAALKAALNRAEAAFKLADELFQRRQKLFERKIINQEDLDRSSTERTLAQANLRQAKVEHERGFLKSPISGIVNHLYVDEGEFIERGKPVADIVNVDKIKINVNVPELDVRYLKPGQKTMVTIDAFQDRRIFGTVYFISYKADPATKTFLVKVLIDNTDQDIRPGMIARVAFLRRVIPDALVAPLFAIVDKGGERLLFVEKEGAAHARTVSIGVIEGDKVQITKGLDPGDHLIVTGQTEVEDGMKVQVR